jgi:hypothetical protein
MTSTISYQAVQAHLDDLYRDARRHPHGYEAHVRQILRRAPPRQVTRRRRMVPAVSRH